MSGMMNPRVGWSVVTVDIAGIVGAALGTTSRAAETSFLLCIEVLAVTIFLACAFLTPASSKSLTVIPSYSSRLS